MVIRVLPASRLLSMSSFTTAAGRSTTSPAAIRLTTSPGRTWILPTPATLITPLPRTSHPRQPSGRAPSQDAWSPVPQVMSRWVEGAGRRAGLHATAGELATGRTSSDRGQLIFGQLGLIGV